MKSGRSLVYLAVASLLAAPMVAHSGYWVDRYGNYVRDSLGNCVKTGNWSHDQATAECDASVEAVSERVARAAALAELRMVTLGSSESFFELGSANLSTEAQNTVDQLAARIVDLGDAVSSVRVSGHTDSTGTAAFNQRLSVQRAQAVADRLAAQGVDAALIQVAGYGQTLPVADNATAEGREQNRRVEIEVVGHEDPK